jgi:hypothetical protein
MPPAVTPEARALLLTAGGAQNDAALRALFSRGIDWDRLLWIADWERATAAVWARIRSLGIGGVPPEVGTSWERLAMVADFRALWLEERLTATVRALAAVGIEVVLLKGAALVQGPYAGFRERPMGDLDLLVAPERAKDAWDVATKTGWMWDSVAYPAGRYSSHHHLPPLLDERRTGVRLEIHTSLSVESHPFALQFSEAMAVSPSVPVGAVSARVLDSPHQLVHLCVHFAWSHMLQFGSWRMFRDADALIACGKVDWPAVNALAGRSGASSCCYWSLRLASSLANVPVPTEVIDALRPRRQGWLLRRIERHIETHLVVADRLCPSERLRRAMWSMAIVPSRLGHGPGRPWDEDAAPVIEVPERTTVAKRARYHGERLAQWARYLRLVFASDRIA